MYNTRYVEIMAQSAGPPCEHINLFVSCVRATPAVLYPVRPALACSWLEWSVGVTAVPAETNLEFIQQSQNSVVGSKKRQECSLLHKAEDKETNMD